MKLTTRIKKSIVQSVIFSGVFFLILSGVFIVSLYPDIKEIQWKKQELSETFDTYNTIAKIWLDFNQFKRNVPSVSDSNYTSLLLENIDESFYSQHFTNTGAGNYNTFLTTVEQKLSDIKSSDEYIKKDRYLNVFLPNYDKNNSFWEDTLTDFYFINYIENLLYSFNLSYEWEIGVGDIVNVEREMQENNQSEVQIDALQENIYAIPLTFELIGRKSDIVDFLHYFENVSRITISQDWFLVYSDQFIRKRIEWSLPWSDYNIYENQLSEIVSLSLEEYPDTSVRSTDSLINTMKNLLWNERYEIDVVLNFYIAGVPSYRMQNYVNNVLELYTTLWSEIKNDTQKFLSQKYIYQSSDELIAIQALQSLDLLMNSFEKDILDLQRLTANPQDIEKTYNLATQYSKQLQKIQESYKTQLEILSR